MDYTSTRLRTEGELRPHVRFMGVLYPHRRYLICKLMGKAVVGLDS